MLFILWHAYCLRLESFCAIFLQKKKQPKMGSRDKKIVHPRGFFFWKIFRLWFVENDRNIFITQWNQFWSKLKVIGNIFSLFQKNIWSIYTSEITFTLSPLKCSKFIPLPPISKFSKIVEGGIRSQLPFKKNGNKNFCQIELSPKKFRLWRLWKNS